MTQLLEIHPDNPQRRLIDKAVTCIRKGGIVAFPTDSAYALGCQLGNKNAADKIRRLRELDSDHNFTLICRDLSEISTYARVDNSVFRLLKAHTPGAYTFILTATNEVPRRLQHPKRSTIGLRVPDNNITQDLLAALDEPLMSVTLIMPGADLPLSDPNDIADALDGRIDMVIDGGNTSLDPTSILDLTDGSAVVVRQGKGDVNAFL